ncbi:MAG: hypothetical protein OXQ29_11035 [Rhodospirillaceae bacterium]|nr:hypothetical protein [Rhodospirillaceae bacterium]
MSDNVKTAAGGRRTGSLFLGFLVFVVLFPFLPLSEARADTEDQTVTERVTRPQCRDAWEGSSADDSCMLYSVDPTPDNKCRITASCSNPWHGWDTTTITVALDRADDLHNCNGRLRDGPC